MHNMEKLRSNFAALHLQESEQLEMIYQKNKNENVLLHIDLRDFEFKMSKIIRKTK